jgi:hypothetical protein
MTTGATKYLYDKAVNEVLRKQRSNSSISEDMLRFSAEQNVNEAYGRAQRHHKDNPIPPKAPNKDALADKHRRMLIQFFTMSNVSLNTAETIVNTDILQLHTN